MKAATPKQRALLRFLGFSVPPGLTLYQAMQMIDRARGDAQFDGRFERWAEVKHRLHPDLYADEPAPTASSGTRWLAAIAAVLAIWSAWVVIEPKLALGQKAPEAAPVQVASFVTSHAPPPVVQPQAKAPPIGDGPRAVTWVPGLRRYVEHDARISPMQKIGFGGGGGPIPTPKPTTAQKIAQEWGWKERGALDQRPR